MTLLAIQNAVLAPSTCGSEGLRCAAWDWCTEGEGKSRAEVGTVNRKVARRERTGQTFPIWKTNPPTITHKFIYKVPWKKL